MEGVYNSKPKDQKPWDVFYSSTDEATSASETTSEMWNSMYKLLKITTIVFIFFTLLGAGIVSKGATFFIVSQLSDHVIPYCDPVDPTSTARIDPMGKVAWFWVLFFSFSFPELLTFLTSARTLLMRSHSKPAVLEFLICLGFEVVHVIGLSILFFIAFPGMDTVRGIMATNAICIMPAIWKIFLKQDIQKMKFRIPDIVCKVLTVISLLMQISALIIWPVATNDSMDYSWALPVGLFLTSFGWWEAFVDKKAFLPSSKLWLVKTKLCDGGARAFTYALIAPIKIAVMFGGMLIYISASEVVTVRSMFNDFTMSFSTQSFYKYSQMAITIPVSMNTFEPAYVLLVQVLCSWFGYMFAKFACKCGIQRQSFAFPLTLVTPLCIFILTKMCADRQGDRCIYRSGIPSHLFFECPAETSSFDWISSNYAWAWILWFLSQCWLTVHVWFPKSQRLASTSQMFSTPNYCSLVLEQSFMLNRRADDGKDSRRFDFKKKHFDASRKATEVQKPKKRKISAFSEQNTDFDGVELDTTTRIYGCATMWHENTQEMAEMLKSIFRIDEDYCSRFVARKFMSIEDPDFYEWETHIFFDDCMERSSDVKDEFIINQFVCLLLKMVEECGRKWYGKRNFKIEVPEIYTTPYGGRIIWNLPGGTKIICHLKDKNKIRHKKRWSQCMYMYYFLGFQLMDNPKLTDAQKEVRAENTFLLALDGDVDFQPEAIIKLVDLMKRNPDVGAACGRIHPIGSGYMQWYQMFEYAIGHWLQKATEHMMGCVLCSPGCFSLFRAKAVMDENVMHRYTTIATQPRHYVQYDQGEDRWLCTLMLQRGWRVEYSAASDSFTACPEGFKEFYNQRRRWMPSTIANIADLLGDYKNVIKNNDDISFLYIVYQIMMMIGTILGPGSIFLMLVGAFNVAFKISNVDALLVNLAIVVFFILVCAFFKSDHQVFVAMVLSLVYAIIMMAVLVGLCLQLGEDGPLAPTSLSLMFVAGAFILAAILHPQEFMCLPMGVIYYITIPSMYLLLMIYSIFNLNNVSWGTREVPKSAAELAAEQEQSLNEAVSQVQKKDNGLLGYFQSMYDAKKKGTIDFSFGNICSCLLFTTDDEKDTKKELIVIADKLDKIERALNLKDEVRFDQKKQEEEFKEKKNEAKTKSIKVHFQPKVERDEMENPYWLEDNEENRRISPQLVKASRKKLPTYEVQFWYSFIKEYLLPLNENKEEKKKISEGLKDLRNQMVMSFMILNSIWVVTIFLFQQNKDTLYIRWPYGPKGPVISFDRDQSSGFAERVDQIIVTYEYLELEPLGVVFMVFFAIVMLIQVIGMIMHRIMTLGHIVSSTHIRRHTNAEEFLNEHGAEIIKDIQKNRQGEETTSMETAIEQTLQSINDGDANEMRRLSNTRTIRRKNKNEHPEVLGELKRRHTQYGKRKATIRKRGLGHIDNANVTIQEEDEEQSNL